MVPRFGNWQEVRWVAGIVVEKKRGVKERSCGRKVLYEKFRVGEWVRDEWWARCFDIQRDEQIFTHVRPLWGTANEANETGHYKRNGECENNMVAIWKCWNSPNIRDNQHLISLTAIDRAVGG